MQLLNCMKYFYRNQPLCVLQGANENAKILSYEKFGKFAQQKKFAMYSTVVCINLVKTVTESSIGTIDLACIESPT